MKKITFLMLLSINFMFAQTATVDVSELSNVASVDILANFGGSFDFFPATDAGSNVWTFDFSPSGDVTNEYKWRVTFDDTTTQEEDLVPKVAGKGLDNDVAVGQDFNTNYFSFCNRVMTIGGDSQSAFFNSFRIPGVVYTEVVVNAPTGNFYYMRYSENGFSTFGGPGAVDNGDGTHTALVRPDAAFEYMWNNDNTMVEENLLDCLNDGVFINTDGANFANRIHAAGVANNDIFNECPTLGVDDYQLDVLIAFPNPTSDLWSLNSPRIMNTIQVFDVLGKQVMSLSPNSTNVNVDASTLRSGLYFARINTAAGTQSLRLVKK
jgi:hypothetical protein